MNISLSDSLKALVDQRVRSGLYSSVSDYVRDLIRNDIDGGQWTIDEATARAIDEGEASGDSRRTFDEIIAEARRTFAVR